MKNVTATMRYIVDQARAEGQSMLALPTDKAAELVDHLRRLDVVVIAAEDYMSAVDDFRLTAAVDDEADEVEERARHLRGALDGVAS